MPVSERQALSLSRRGRADPVWWVHEVLNKRPTTYQCEWLEAVRDNRYVAIRTCHGTGKSGFAGGMLIPWYLCTHPGSEVVNTAPTYRQVVNILWKEIGRARRNARMPLGGTTTKSSWHLSESWFAIGFTSADHDGGDKFQGLHSESGDNLVVVDEAAGVAELIYEEGISSIMSSEGSKLLLIGNPTSVKGEFRNAFKRDSDYVCFKKSAWETPNFTKFGIKPKHIKSGEWKNLTRNRELPAPYLVTPAWVANRYKRWGPDHPQYRARVDAVFPLAGNDAIIPQWALDAARERWGTLKKEGWHRWGVDPGGRGPDPSVIGEAWQSGYYSKVYQESKTNLANLALRIAATARGSSDPPASINIDVVGLGMGVYDTLKLEPLWDEKRGREIMVCQANGAHSPRDKIGFMNARAEWYWGLRRRFEDGHIAIDPHDLDLYEELQELMWRVTPSGKVLIESKEDFRRRVGKSPDNADALCYAFAELDSHEMVVLGG